jgi:hypothetical protein
MTKDPQRSSRFTFPASEMLIVAAILSTLWAFFLLTVNAAREIPRPGIRDAQPPLLPQLKPLYEPNPWRFIIGTPVVVTAGVATLLGILRCFLPETIRRHFPWKARPRPPFQPPEPILDSRPAIVTSAMALIATTILIFAASHVRADRTNRRPIVTWEGPIADYVQHAAILGWLLSAAAVGLGAYTLYRFRSKLNFLASIGMCVGFMNYFGSCLFWAAVYED